MTISTVTRSAALTPVKPVTLRVSAAAGAAQSNSKAMAGNRRVMSVLPRARGSQGRGAISAFEREMRRAARLDARGLDNVAAFDLGGDAAQHLRGRAPVKAHSGGVIDQRGVLGLVEMAVGDKHGQQRPQQAD